MRILVSIILLLLWVTEGSAQNRFFKIDSILNSRTCQESEKIAVYRSAYQSYNVISNGYIFCRKADSFYIRKIQYSEYPDNVIYTYEYLAIPKNYITRSFYNMKNELLNEGPIKSFENEKSGMSNGVFSTGKPIITHGRYSRILIFYDDSIYDKPINHFDLRESTDVEKKYRNEHYEYNNSLKLVELERNLREFISELEERNLFQLIEE